MAGGANGPRFADATDLERWADRRDAQADLPRLIRRLIRHENDQVQRCEMVGGDSVGKHGYDGIVESTRSTSFVPEGTSVWEMGVSSDPRAKANADYRTRTDDPLGVDLATTTFVFVTPRRWDEKKDWETKKRQEGKWRDVRVLDANDIEQALEECPAVNVFLSELLDMPAHGVVTIEDWWRRYAAAFDPVLTSGVVLAGREDVSAALLRRLSQDTGRTLIRAASVDDGLAFAACTMLTLGAEESEPLLSRSLLVHDGVTLRRLDSTSSLLVLMPYEEKLHRDAWLVQNHHVVFIITEGDADIELPPLDHLAVEAPLRDAGVPADDLWRYVRAANKSLVSLQRVASRFGPLAPQQWISDLKAPVIRRAWLAGSWNSRRSGDIEIIQAFIGATAEELDYQLETISRQPDPLFTRVGPTWTTTSPNESWPVARTVILEPDLEALESVVQVVLGAVDPRLDLPTGDRWSAALFGKTRIHSRDLRGGLSRSLALLGARGDEVRLGGGRSGREWAERIVFNILARANNDASSQLWASLDDVMPLLAEAAPDVFLRAVDRGTSGDHPILSRLFQDRDGDWNGSSPHTGLLWALESLAWSSNYLGLSSELLAVLAELDPGGRLSNRPSRSLVEIFRPWRPGSAASASTRAATLDALMRRHPGVTRRLLLNLLPEHRSVGMNTRKPEFRDWARGGDRAVPVVEFQTMIEGIVGLLISSAREDPASWPSIIHHFDRFPSEARGATLEALEVLSVDALSSSLRLALFDAIDGFIRKHRHFGDTDWAVSEEWLARLEVVGGRLVPTSPHDRWRWLFEDWMPDLPVASDEDSYQAELSSARIAAMREIVQWGGPEAASRLAEQVELPWAVGASLAEVVPPADVRSVLVYFESPSPRLVQFADAFSRRYFGQDADRTGAWLSDFSDRPTIQARLLQTVSDVQAAWRMVDELGDEVRRAYWSEFMPYGRGAEFEYVSEVARQLIRHGRYAMAVDALSLYSRRDGSNISSDLVIEALSLFGAEADPESPRVSDHDLTNLLDLLRNREVDEEIVASLEWKFLPVLGYQASVPSLQNLIARDPATFVQLVVYAFRPATAAASLDEDIPRGLATNAYRLLGDWKVVPGTQPDGTVDSAALEGWLEKAVELLFSEDRVEVGELQIGEVFAYAPADADATFPTRPVRDVLEAASSDRFARGFSIGLRNRRGVTARSLTEGGRQEYELADKYDAWAESIASTHPRTAAILRGVAADYRSEGRRNDEEARRFMEGLDR